MCLLTQINMPHIPFLFSLPRSFSVRGQFRLLPVGLLQCMGHPKPPCHLLMLPGVTPAHKGLTPSGLSFIQRTLLNLPFKAHTCYIRHAGDTAYLSVSFSNQISCILTGKCVKISHGAYNFSLQASRGKNQRQNENEIFAA